jgi:mannosyltransferase
VAASKHELRGVIRAMAADVHPPLHTSILHAVILGFGDCEAVLRLPSAVLGIAAVAATFWVGSLIGGRTVGLLSAAFLCLSGFHLHYSQEARPYALLSLTATLFAGATIQALETNRRKWHAASSATALLLLYSHNYGLLLWLSLSVAIIASAKICRDPDEKVLTRWVGWQAVAVLLFLPWAVILWGQFGHIETAGFWIQRPDAAFMVDLVENLASGGVMALALFAAAALALAPASRRPVAPAEIPFASQGHVTLRRLFLLAWLFGPLLLALIASLTSQPILIPKYLIGSLPAWLILASMGFARLDRMWGRWVAAVAILGAIVNLWFYEPVRHEDARAIAAAYLERAQPAECVFIFRPYGAIAVEYYLRNPPACFLRANASTDIKPWAFAPARAWLFLGYVSAEDRRHVDENLKAHGWQKRAVVSDPSVSLLVLEPAK